MSIQRYRKENPRTASEIADAIGAELQSIKSDAPVVRGTENFAFIQSMASVLATQELSLVDLYNAAYITDATGEELTRKARGIGVDRNEPAPSTGVVKFTRSSPASTTYSAPAGTRVTTGGDNGITFETEELAVIEGPSTNTDSTLYSTSNTSLTTKTTFTVDIEYRDTVDVSGDLRTTDGSYTATLSIIDVTNSNTIDTFTTTNTSLTTKGPTTYDTSGLGGDIDIEFQIKIGDASASAELDESTVEPGGETAAKANISCLETGSVGNVGASTVDTLIDEPAGIEGVTNPNATGDPTFTLTDGTTPLSSGQDRETDTELRERALESTAIGGAGTVPSVELALENIDDVISADVFSNRSDSTVNGVDPWHTEVRVYGGNTNDIALRLYEVLPLGTLNTLQGGVNGTLNTVTLTKSDLLGDLTVEITRPVEITLEIDLDVVHTKDYSGTDSTKDAIVEYIGGTSTEGRNITGLGQGENVLINEIENVVEDVSGVDYANVTLVDADGDGTDDTTTDSDGVPVYSITESEVPVANAADITVSETAR